MEVVRLQIIPEEEGKRLMREFYKDIKVRFFKDYEGWHYEVTGFQSPHERTTHFTGPFRFKWQARRDYKREFIAPYK